MRRVGLVLFVLVTALVAASCDTSQPSHGGAATLEVQVDARSQVLIYDCYDRVDNSVTPPVVDRISCFPAAGQGASSRAIPWAYSFRIIILRAGTTFPDILAGSVNDPEFVVFGNTTRFDTTRDPAVIRLPEPPFTYENGRRVSAGNQDFFLGWVDQGGGNIRPPIPLPVVNILEVPPASPGTSPRFSFELHAGDAIIVEAGKQEIRFGPNIFPPNTQPQIELSGQLFIAGSPATPNAGTFVSAGDDGAGFSFNYISD